MIETKNFMFTPFWKITFFGFYFWPVHYLIQPFRSRQWSPYRLWGRSGSETEHSIFLTIPLVGQFVRFTGPCDCPPSEFDDEW